MNNSNNNKARCDFSRPAPQTIKHEWIHKGSKGELDLGYVCTCGAEQTPWNEFESLGIEGPNHRMQCKRCGEVITVNFSATSSLLDEHVCRRVE